MPPPSGELPRRLGLVDAASIFVGIILGSGIFVAPAAVAGATSSPALAIGLWILGGLITICGAFCYAECGARLPRTGGFYVFYREVYGDAVAFVGGWIALFVTYPASIAAIALIFAQYLGRVVPSLARLPEAAAATLVILVGGFLNVVGVRTGALAQRALSGTKVAALGLLCLAALLAPGAPLRGGAASSPGALGGAGFAGLLAALVALLWTYDGWSDVTLVSGEIRNPERNLGRAVLLGSVVLVSVYATVQLAVQVLLPAQQAASSKQVLSEAVQQGLGAGAGRVVALLVVVSTFGSIQGIVLAVSRLGFAMARDRAFLRWFGAVHPRWHTPARASGALVAASIFYVFAGNFRNLLDYFTFSVWIFYALTAVALLVLRRRRVGEGTWRAPGGVAVPAVVLATALGMTSGLLIQDPLHCLYGLLMLGAGFAAYGVWKRFVPGT